MVDCFCPNIYFNVICVFDSLAVFLRICLWALYFGQTSRKCSISSPVAHVLHNPSGCLPIL